MSSTSIPTRTLARSAVVGIPVQKLHLSLLRAPGSTRARGLHAQTTLEMAHCRAANHFECTCERSGRTRVR